MTKVKFITRSASANGVIQVGEVVEVPDNEAKLLIAGKFAVLAEPAAEAEEERQCRQCAAAGVLRWRWQLFNASGTEVLDLEATSLFKP